MRYNYYYISLEKVDGVRLLESRKINLKNLKKNNAIPAKYVVERDSYQLLIEITDYSYSPHVRITLVGNEYTLTPKRNLNVVSDNGVICSSYYPDSVNKSILSYSWSVDCLSNNLEKLITFTVENELGVVVSKESFPFEVKQDGEYQLMDAL